MFNPTEVPAGESFISQWERVVKPLTAYCRHKHFDIETDDLVSTTKLDLFNRFTKEEITEFNLSYAIETALSAARDIRRDEQRDPNAKKRWQTISIETIQDPIIEEDPSDEIDARKLISVLIDGCDDPRVIAVVQEICLTDDEHTDVCKRHHIRLLTFKKYCRWILAQQIGKAA
jgi:hypothetical protein